MCGSDGIRRGNYFGGMSVGRAEFEVRVGKLKIKRPQVRMRSHEK